jgi:hypothetical protein
MGVISNIESKFFRHLLQVSLFFSFSFICVFDLFDLKDEEKKER